MLCQPVIPCQLQWFDLNPALKWPTIMILSLRIMRFRIARKERYRAGVGNSFGLRAASQSRKLAEGRTFNKHIGILL